jgi:tetratricopeptide (TPR) repeat protein
MRRPALVLAAAAFGAVLAVTGCDRPRVSAPATTPALATDDLRDGDAALARADWPAAIAAYHRAIDRDPGAVKARYGLAVALSHLERNDEAADAFQWVVEHAGSATEEARIATQWLASRRGSAGPAVAAKSEEDESGPVGRLEGRTEWRDLDPERPKPNLQLLLESEDPASDRRRYWAKTRLNDRYEFPRVAPGRYRLVAQVGPIRLWEARTVVREGQPTVLDLTSATSVAPADALRPRPS